MNIGMTIVPTEAKRFGHHEDMNDKALRKHLTSLLEKSEAHANFEKAAAGLQPELQGIRPPQAVHSPWEMLEHLRISQWDIVEFSHNPKHKSPSWPEGYWPKSPVPAHDRAWQDSVAAFLKDRKTMVDLVNNPQTDLFAAIAHGQGQTVLREALVLADHNAYHIGELVLLRRLLGAWKG
jgi:DinB family protein